MKNVKNDEFVDVEVEGQVQPEVLEVDEIIEEYSNGMEDLNADQIEENFQLFMTDLDMVQAEVSKGIKIDDLKEIGAEVVKARDFLMSFTNGENKSSREQAYSTLGMIPYLGKWAKEKENEAKIEHIKSESVKDVVNGIFTNFEGKKKQLLALSEMITQLRSNLIVKEQKLEAYIHRLNQILDNPSSPTEKLKAYDMSVMAMAQSSVTKELAYTQIDIIVDLLGDIMMKISKTMPSLKSIMNDSLDIVGTINAIKDAVDMVGTLETLSNEIVRTSTSNVQKLIVEVTDSLSEGIDIEFYKESAARHEAFNKQLTQAKIKKFKKKVEDFETLQSIQLDTSNQLEYRRKEEAKALGMQIDTIKDAANMTSSVADSASISTAE